MALSTKFSITVQLGTNNQEITLYASDFANVETKGWHFELPPNSTTAVGSLSDLIGWINQKLGSSLPTTVPATWPDTIKNIFTGVLGATVTVNRFTIDQAPKVGNSFPAMEYSLDVSAKVPATGTTPGSIPLIPNVLNVAGAGFTVTKTNS